MHFFTFEDASPGLTIGPRGGGVSARGSFEKYPDVDNCLVKFVAEMDVEVSLVERSKQSLDRWERSITRVERSSEAEYLLHDLYGDETSGLIHCHGWSSFGNPKFFMVLFLKSEILLWFEKAVLALISGAGSYRLALSGNISWGLSQSTEEQFSRQSELIRSVSFMSAALLPSEATS